MFWNGWRKTYVHAVFPELRQSTYEDTANTPTPFDEI
jgi:hypothetical protein